MEDIMNLNHVALNNTRTVIKRDFGDLSDLHEELQNTIANIYYTAAIIGQNPEQYVFRKGLKGIKKGIVDSTFYVEGVKSLPEFIKLFREEVVSKGNEKDIKFMTEFLLLSYKYRIESLSSKPYFYAKILKFFNRRKVNEIPGLFRMIKINAIKHRTFQDWYSVFKATVIKISPHLKLNKDGDCLVDFMDHESLDRAFRDGVDPESLAIEFGDFNHEERQPE